LPHLSGRSAFQEQCQQWQLTDDDSLSDEYEIEVLADSGQPRKDIDVLISDPLTNRCFHGGSIGQTDSTGTATIDLDPSVTGLTLIEGDPDSADAGKKARQLTDAELHQLFKNHKLTIHW